MKISRLIAYGCILLLFVLAMLHIAVYHSELNEPIGTHFDVKGQVDGWMSKSAFTIVYVATELLIVIIMIGIGKLTYILPDSMINVPKKEYWLSPAKRVETLASLETMLAWISVVTMLFIMSVNHFIILLNLQKIKSMSFWMIMSTILYSVFLIGLVVGTTYRFYRVKDKPVL